MRVARWQVLALLSGMMWACGEPIEVPAAGYVELSLPGPKRLDPPLDLRIHVRSQGPG